MKWAWSSLFIGLTCHVMPAGANEAGGEKPIQKMMKQVGPEQYFVDPPKKFGGERHRKIYETVRMEGRTEIVLDLTRLDEARESLIAELTELWEKAKQESELKTLFRLEKIRDGLRDATLKRLPEDPEGAMVEREIVKKWNAYMKKLDALIAKQRMEGINSYGKKLVALKRDLIQEEKLEEAKSVAKEIERVAAVSRQIQQFGASRESGSSARKVVMKIPEDAATRYGHSYALISQKMSWDAAKKHCDEMGGYLVIFESNAEANWVRDWLKRKRKEPAWIGLSRKSVNNSWRWVDGSLLNVRCWTKGQPDDREGEIYGVLQKGGMHDAIPGRAVVPYFICEWPGVREESRLSPR